VLVPVNVLRSLNASFSECKPFSQLQNHHSPFLTLRLSFLTFFKGTMLPNSNKIETCEILVMVVQQLEDTFILKEV
jgi:hypothetical protein